MSQEVGTAVVLIAPLVLHTFTSKSNRGDCGVIEGVGANNENEKASKWVRRRRRF